MAEDRILEPLELAEERAFEAGLRPRRLAEYIGQPRVKENLGVFLKAARKRAEPLDHL
ncbi:MAG: Holliday junction branch migration DNA helicase RuvB, partial [Acidobacteria bacterium]|nr:Holliday junction branch migration DNA helicase RuvB [Acidobacteriota bacterium]